MSVTVAARTQRVQWEPVLERATEIVGDFKERGVELTLRGLFYRLVSEVLLPNTINYYKSLSSRTAEARRDGWFPDLVDQTRQIIEPITFDGPAEAKQWLKRIYRRDRLQEFDVSTFIGVEKQSLATLLEARFYDRGIPIIPLRGYSSQTFVDDVRRRVESDSRSAVLIYAGDYDPSGEDIARDFNERTGGCFSEFTKVALSWQQVERFGLPPQMGKATDTRAADFVRRNGHLIQVELEALPPNTLLDLYEKALTEYWQPDEYERALEQEERDREALR